MPYINPNAGTGSTPATWGNIAGDIANQGDLNVIIQSILDRISSLENQVEALANAVEELQEARH
jgi:hypothetical protein